MHEQASNAARANWLGILSRATPADIDAVWSGPERSMPVEWLRRPQVGLVMVRGRAGGTGNPFNLGEMTVTRCSLQLADGTVGHGYVQGRDRRQAELAARLDALLQRPADQPRLLAEVIEPLRRLQVERRRDRSRKAASTRVEFFTMVRGENAA